MLSVLQRFVPSKSGYNHLIQSVYTPETCLIRKCVNPHLVSDATISVDERTATFEADLRPRTSHRATSVQRETMAG